MDSSMRKAVSWSLHTYIIIFMPESLPCTRIAIVMLVRCRKVNSFAKVLLNWWCRIICSAGMLPGMPKNWRLHMPIFVRQSSRWQGILVSRLFREWWLWMPSRSWNPPIGPCRKFPIRWTLPICRFSGNILSDIPEWARWNIEITDDMFGLIVWLR